MGRSWESSGFRTFQGQNGYLRVKFIQDHWNIPVERPRGVIGVEGISGVFFSLISKVTERCDVYSYAMLLFEMITNEIPWQHREFVDVFRMVAFENLRPKLPEIDDNKINKEAYEQIYSLIQECWLAESEARLKTL
jgi:serine/threonine protein kinase